MPRGRGLVTIMNFLRNNKLNTYFAASVFTGLYTLYDRPSLSDNIYSKYFWKDTFYRATCGWFWPIYWTSTFIKTPKCAHTFQ